MFSNTVVNLSTYRQLTTGYLKLSDILYLQMNRKKDICIYYSFIKSGLSQVLFLRQNIKYNNNNNNNNHNNNNNNNCYKSTGDLYRQTGKIPRGYPCWASDPHNAEDLAVRLSPDPETSFGLLRLLVAACTRTSSMILL